MRIIKDTVTKNMINNYRNKKDGVITVSEITNSIKLLLETHIGLISVEGEISNYKPHYSGHKYFTLKDDKSQISCTMWKTRNVNFELSDGQNVIVTGNISVYPPRGNYQIDVISITPVGIGDLYRAYEILKEKLSERGYFAQERKKLLPELPLNIGVSTSPTGAAVKDIFSTVKRRFSPAKIFFRPTVVQGDSAAEDIVAAINELQNTPSDVIIIGRGGGSIEDLWAYNTEVVANAIYNCKIPIISAVGHETDFTIADFVADFRAATPTAAAELATPQTYFDLIQNILIYQNSMTQSIYSLLDKYHKNIDVFLDAQTNRRVMEKVYYFSQLLDMKEEAMNKDIKHKISNNLLLIENLENQCNLLSPLSPLRRGYALLKYKNNVIKNEQSLSEYNRFEIIREKEKVIAKFDKLIEEDLFSSRNGC